MQLLKPRERVSRAEDLRLSLWGQKLSKRKRLTSQPEVSVLVLEADNHAVNAFRHCNWQKLTAAGNQIVRIYVMQAAERFL